MNRIQYDCGQRIKLKKEQEQAVIALLEKKEVFAFCQLVLAKVAFNFRKK